MNIDSVDILKGVQTLLKERYSIDSEIINAYQSRPQFLSILLADECQVNLFAFSDYLDLVYEYVYPDAFWADDNNRWDLFKLEWENSPEELEKRIAKSIMRLLDTEKAKLESLINNAISDLQTLQDSILKFDYEPEE